MGVSESPDIAQEFMENLLQDLLEEIVVYIDRIPSTTPGAEPPRDARDSGSAR